MKKRHSARKAQTQSISDIPEGFVYFLVDDSPPHMYSQGYSIVYELLQSLFDTDPISESDALEAINTLNLDMDASTILRVMTKYHYLHKASLREVLK